MVQGCDRVGTHYFRPSDLKNADATPPEMHTESTPAMLWPPNHKLVQIVTKVNVSDADDPDPAVRLEAITCDDQCVAADDIIGGVLGTDDREFELRAERTGEGEGRTYTITYSATDALGNRALATTTVVVPHDRGKK